MLLICICLSALGHERVFTTDRFEVVRFRLWVVHLPVTIERHLTCGGELKVIAAILEQAVIEKILTNMGPVAATSRVLTRRARAPRTQG